MDLAAVRDLREQAGGTRVALVISGGNIDSAVLDEALRSTMSSSRWGRHRAKKDTKEKDSLSAAAYSALISALDPAERMQCAVLLCATRVHELVVALRPMILPTMRSLMLMTEDLYAFLPAAHPLASRESVSFGDLDGESFLVLSEVGFWMGMLRRNMPNAQIVEQADRTVFEQLVQTTDLISFATDITLVRRDGTNRAAVPIVDADAHATFYLTVLSDSPARVQDIFDWVERSVAQEA